MSALTDNLIELAEMLEVRAKSAEAQAEVHRSQNESADAAKEDRRAKSGAKFAKVCRDAAAKLSIREKQGAFTPPTLEEVTGEMKRWGLPASEAVKFIGHYQSNGWKVGKNRMSKWEAAVVTWRLRYFEEHPKERSVTAPTAKADSLPDLFAKDDPEGWTEFLKREGQPYKAYRFAADWLKLKFKNGK